MKRICVYMIFILLISSYSHAFKLGLENIPSQIKNELLNKRARIGIVTNQTGVDQRGKRNIDRLLEEGYHVTTILVPEHGLNGHAGNGERINNSRDKHTNIPIVSLYKGETKKNGCKGRDLTDLDVLFFDMQDSGMRHYTYISTLYNVLQAAAKHNKRLVVLDRPNPLGAVMEGPLVDPNQLSFISIAPIPVRHGMTMGEIARYFNHYILPHPARLTIIKMDEYDRHAGFNGKMLTMLSSALRTPESCYGYSFLGMLGEVRPFFIGIRTDKPFQVIMLHKKYGIKNGDWNSLKNQLRRLNIHSSLIGAQHNEAPQYTGLQLHIKDINRAAAFSAFLKTVTFFKKKGIPLSFAPTFNLATGTAKVKEYIQGSLSASQLKQYIHPQLHTFYKKAETCFLYKPYPHITPLMI